MTIRAQFASWIRRAVGLPSAPIGATAGNYSLLASGTNTPLAYSAAWACVQVLTQDMAKLPLELWTGSDRTGWTPARLHPLWQLLRKPNAWMNRFELIRYQVLSVLTDGNSYNLIVRDREMNPVQLIPIHPRYVSVYQAYDGELFYGIGCRYGPLESLLPDDAAMTVPQRDILHIRNLSLDGIIGLSTLGAARYAVEYGVNLERQGTALSGRGGKPGGVIYMPHRLQPDQAKRLREEWDQIYNGEGQGKTAILEEGVKFEPLAFRAVDAQFLESRRFQLEEVARFFRVWPFLIGAMEKLSYNNVEHLMKLHVDSTLAPIAELFTAAYAFAFELGESNVLEFDFDTMLMADTERRYKKYSTGIQWGMFSPNDALQMEGLNPYEGGDVHLRPLNMLAVEDEPVAARRPAGGKGANNE